MFIGDDYIPDQDYESEEEEEYYYYQDMIEAEKNRDLSWLYDEEDDPYADEEWKDIPGYEGLYQASTKGRIRSLDKIVERPPKGPYFRPGQIFKPTIKRSSGYARVTLRKDGKEWRGGVHQLIALTFLENPENKPYVDHNNTIRTDNDVNNLEWVSRLENANNPLTCYHHSIAIKGKPRNDIKGKKLPLETIEKCIVKKQRKGSIHLHTDENGNLIYKNGLIDPRKYQD